MVNLVVRNIKAYVSDGNEEGLSKSYGCYIDWIAWRNTCFREKEWELRKMNLIALQGEAELNGEVQKLKKEMEVSIL